jgi:uncharacterized membrane protein
MLELIKSLKRKFKLFVFYPPLIIMILIGILFPLFGTINRVQDRFQKTEITLSGSKYADLASYDDIRGSINLKSDMDAIKWLKRNEKVTKNIIEGIAPIYSWGSRFSIYTGFPTVMGWDWHQTQQREYKTSLIQERKNDVNEFYSTTDLATKINILNKYKIEIIILGQLEKSYYPTEGIESFNDLIIQNKIIEIYSNDNTAIFKVTN